MNLLVYAKSIYQNIIYNIHSLLIIIFFSTNDIALSLLLSLAQGIYHLAKQQSLIALRSLMGNGWCFKERRRLFWCQIHNFYLSGKPTPIKTARLSCPVGQSISVSLFRRYVLSHCLRNMPVQSTKILRFIVKLVLVKSCHFIMAYRVYVYIYRFKVTFFYSYLSNENKSSNSALLSIKSSAENVISLCPIFINSSVKILCAVK